MLNDSSKLGGVRAKARTLYRNTAASEACRSTRQGGSNYCCVCASPGGFLRKLAISYVSHGYLCYATGTVADKFDPSAVDSSIVERYQLGLSKDQRYRLKARGEANIQYLRHKRFYVLLATKGEHTFFQRENYFDFRKKPLHFQCYLVSFVNSRVSVLLDGDMFKTLRAYSLEVGKHRAKQSAEELIRKEFSRFEPYAGVKTQFLSITREVNQARKLSGFKPINIHLFRVRP